MLERDARNLFADARVSLVRPDHFCGITEVRGHVRLSRIRHSRFGALDGFHNLREHGVGV